MKIFSIYAKVELIKKPDWLDDFRAKYDVPYPYHITLKPSTVIEDTDVEDVKSKLANVFSNLQIPGNNISLKFNKLHIHRSEDTGICIMVDSEANELINNLQKEILSTLADYNNYRKEKYRGYAENFRPHITIGRNLTEELNEEASKDLEKDYTCEAVVNKIVLVVVNNANAEEANDPANQTIFGL